MEQSGPVSPWPGYPNIPIYLDLGNHNISPPNPKRQTSSTNNTIISDSPVSPLDQPHCITVTPPKDKEHNNLPLDTGFARKFLGKPSTQRSPVRHLSPVEYPGVNKLSESWTTRGPATRLTGSTARTVRGPSAVSQFRFGDSPSYHKMKPQPPIPNGGTLGLGIIDDQYKSASPDCERPPPVPEKDQNYDTTPNIAQRIEDRLWHYSMHGNIFKRWLLEIISWCISAVCMTAIVGVLWLLKDKPLRTWPLSSTFTLNAYVATLSRVASAALLLPVSEALGQLKWSWFFQGTSKKMWDFEIFDNASRGPWGSLQLLVRTKGRKLAALGAAIVLLALALDPFFQQVLDNPSRWTLHPDKSFLPTAYRYEPGGAPVFFNGTELGTADRELKLIAEKFFFKNGTEVRRLGEGIQPDLSVVCPTGNCKWEPYETLGICNQCADISEYLTFNCTRTRVDWIHTLNGTGWEDNYPTAYVCGYFLNSTSENPTLMSGYIASNDSVKEEVLLHRALPMLSVPARDPIFDGSIHFKQYRNPIVDILIVGAANGTVESVYDHQMPIALECVVNWCAKTINSTYEDGVYKEEDLSTFLNTTEGPSPWKGFPVMLDGLQATDLYFLQDIVLDNPAKSANASTYHVSNETAIKTVAVFDDIFPSFYTYRGPSELPLLRNLLYTASWPETRALNFVPWLYPNNVTHHMDRLAKAMTDRIRSSSGHGTVEGTSYFSENYVAVRFEWLVLPVGLLLFSGIFLITTMIRTSREKENVGVWKTSAVATLLYGFPSDLKQKIVSSAPKGNTPRARAKELKVELQAGKGWRVSGGLFSPLTPKVRQYQHPPGWI